MHKKVPKTNHFSSFSIWKHTRVGHVRGVASVVIVVVGGVVVVGVFRATTTTTTMAPRSVLRIPTLNEEDEGDEEDDDLSIYDPKHARVYDNHLQELKMEMRRQKRLAAEDKEGNTVPPPQSLLRETHSSSGFTVPALRPLPEGTRYAPGYEPRTELEKEIGASFSLCIFLLAKKMQSPTHPSFFCFFPLVVLTTKTHDIHHARGGGEKRKNQSGQKCTV